MFFTTQNSNRLKHKSISEFDLRAFRRKHEVPRWKRVTEGRRRKNRTETGGWLKFPGLATQRDSFRADCFINVTPSRRPDAVGWAPSVWQARWLPPSGDCGSVASCHLTMADRVKGGDPKTDQEGTTRTPGWHPEEKAPQLPKTKKVLSYQRGLQQHTAKGRDPRTPASWRHWLMQVVAATTGMIRLDGRIRLPRARRGQLYQVLRHCRSCLSAADWWARALRMVVCCGAPDVKRSRPWA